MSGPPETAPVIETLEEFLAHALALETEASETYQEIGDAMAVHNNPEVAALFRRLAQYGRRHAEEVRARAAGRTLPHISPWDFKWPDTDSPEKAAHDMVHYLMTPAQALALAMRAERRANAFYAEVAGSSPSREVRVLAAEFAAEEAEHVRQLTEWMKAHPAPGRDWHEDPDPPFMPE